jgi:hypothetical protein
MEIQQHLVQSRRFLQAQVTVGDHGHHPPVAGVASQVPQEQECAAVSPMDILQHQQHGSAGAQCGQAYGQVLKQLLLFGLGVVKPGLGLDLWVVQPQGRDEGEEAGQHRIWDFLPVVGTAFQSLT